jgi:hypothetical protein
LKENKFRIPKSRYGSVSSYLSNSRNNRAEYSDIEFPYDDAIFRRVADHGMYTFYFLAYLAKDTDSFIDSGIDDVLAKHIAHLFIRDPLVIFSESVDLDDDVSSDHFEVRIPFSFLSMSLNQDMFPRTSNRQIGRLCDSNRPHQTLPWVGASSSEAWKSR